MSPLTCYGCLPHPHLIFLEKFTAAERLISKTSFGGWGWGMQSKGKFTGIVAPARNKEERLLIKMKLLVTLGKEETRWLDPRGERS